MEVSGLSFWELFSLIRFLGAHFLRQSRKKPGYPLQSFLPHRGKKVFPLLSLARSLKH
jgi:hypothetical protein